MCVSRGRFGNGPAMLTTACRKNHVVPSDLAQDLLESVVEGPEADSIYELYVAPCEGSATKPGNAGGVGGEAIDLDEADDAAWAVEAAQAADDVIVVD